MRSRSVFRNLAVVLFAGVLAASLYPPKTVQADDAAIKRVLEAEAKRIAVIEKVKPSVVAIFARGGQGGGSGVLISKDGYALTNFHVVQGTGPTQKCGLADGVLYDAVIVGLDKVGDVALIKLLPKEKGKDFPFSPMADSDKVKVGEWSLAMGNPFLLATDFNPTVTFGLVSGVHRYQYPEGTLLEYTDCIQIDTSINPGNSGGPLFNMEGEVIGINGRGSFEKRARINSGVGYAISINQIKNFMGHLRAGLDTDHATLGADIRSELEEEGGKVMVKHVLEDSDVSRRGLDVGDEMVSFAGRPITSTNQYKNILGIYPKGWRLPLVYRRDNVKYESLVRLMKLQRDQAGGGQGGPNPGPQPGRGMPPQPPSEASALYEPKPGFTNYYFNKLERERLLAGFRKHGDFSSFTGLWTLEGDSNVKKREAEAQIVVGEEADNVDKDGKPIVRQWTYHLNLDAPPPNDFPQLPEKEEKGESSLRQAVRKAFDLVRTHATDFPQEIWAKETDAQTKEQAAALHKKREAIQKELLDALEELKKVGKDRDKEDSRLWKAQYDYALAKLSAFCAYVHEYQFLLAQMRDNLPQRDPKQHRGWRMVSSDNLQSGAEANRLAGEANALWRKMLKDYADTVWDDRAKANLGTQLGLHWEPSVGKRTIVRIKMGDVKYELDPLLFGQDLQVLKDPPGSGGLMTALYHYRRFLTRGPAGFEGGFHHGGQEPFYPPSTDNKKPDSFADRRVDAEVIVTEHAGAKAKWYFSLKDQTLLGFEVSVDDRDDPCEVYLSDYRMVDGRLLPHRFDVRHGNDPYGTFLIKKYQLAEIK